MSYELKWLEGEPSLINDDTLYDIDKAKQKYEVVPLDELGWLIINDSDPYDKGVKYSGWMKFAVLTFATSNCDGSEAKGALICHGEGPSASLRECRHTYWGEASNGYLFYFQPKLITLAFKELERFYDFY
jgi:hypothetical protein